MSIAITDMNKLAKITPQQVGPISMKIIATYGGKHIVRVHEVLDQEYRARMYRFAISVDLKFWKYDALRDAGWLGLTRAEATNNAKDLVVIIASIVRALEACDKSPDMKGIEYTKQRHTERLDRILKKYSCEIE
jgi:hypothetical protein